MVIDPSESTSRRVGRDARAPISSRPVARLPGGGRRHPDRTPYEPGVVMSTPAGGCYGTPYSNAPTADGRVPVGSISQSQSSNRNSKRIDSSAIRPITV